MPLNYASPRQASGYRFLRHRLDTAVARHTVTLIHDPSRAYVACIAVGVVIAILITGFMFLVKVIRPASRIGEATILADKASSGLYVKVGDVIHPVLNLASARIIAGQDSNPTTVPLAEIQKNPQGPLLGIPGAPNDLTVRTPLSVGWGICDRLGSTQAHIQPKVTVIAGTATLGDWTTTLSSPQAALMHYQGHSFLVTDGHRIEIDRANRGMMLALGISATATSSPMSQALYDALPPTPPLTVPEIVNPATPVGFPSPTPLLVGNVLTTTTATGEHQYFLALAAGVQQIPATVASMLRNSGPAANAPITVTPAQVAAMPATPAFDLSYYPPQPVQLVNQETSPFTCVTWRKDNADPSARIQVIAGRRLPIPLGAENRLIIPASGGPGIADAVYLTPDSPNFVRLTGNEPSSTRAESLWWITDSGVRHGIATTSQEDSKTRASLGLNLNPTPAPWVVLSRLPIGLTLSYKAAMTAHDGLLADPTPRPLAPATQGPGQ